jgi:Protein of unknown function (DUF3175)
MAMRRPSSRNTGRRAHAGRSARRTGRRWSQHVTRTSNALDLEPSVFTLRSARAVAASLRRSALRSRRRKGSPYQSAISMLNFYINRAGTSLSPSRKIVLERAKRALRRAFGREPR